MSAETLSPSAKVFLLPDLGEGLTEAELVNWLVAEGDTVVVDQPVAEVETAKSTVEVPSPFAGVVTRLHGEAGTTINVGAPLISVRPDGAPGAPAGSADAEAYREEERAGVDVPSDGEVASAPAASEAEADAGGSGNVLIGYGTPGTGTGGRTRRRKSAAAAPAPAAAAPAAPVNEPATETQAVLCISPLVRKLARDAGIDLRSISGSGANGMILRRDVEQALGSSKASQTDSVASAGSGRAAASTLSGTGDEDRRSGLGISDRIPVKGVRKTVAEAMSRSRREIPEATVWVDVDATALVNLRAELKRRQPDSTPGILAFVARFALAGLAKYPELNTRIVEREDGTSEILRFDGVNLGIAAQTDRGLMVPSVHRADRLSARELDAEIRRLAAVARDGKATPAELTSGTFTLNNYGVFGVDGSAAIINYPEAAILGLGRIIDRPWVVEGELDVRKVTELTLAFDHRVCDGGVAGGFLRYVADAIENPGGVLADL
ncbi:pyruvate dehydrogenase E2 component (dihydrolipoamide acetyltransferase) [Arthrobacter pigmenti]|uniref:Dihydrolipoamide acetyltransferase component of pyruvate dehydrogenase complex n=1 Tax=Arthrobacter pigmenti TaxID=271432 RepID=A0A846RSA8_9MICC|nr:dihydrolipoamide acetyltransferase family protein [Arthrobacter pigmenti]NJC23344.1 pyruvate dehydrogenase E2 component (dihydrolipoamide acetyltransferase) [Arthrobacter pigmenti]